jgi:hypothetical protein
VHIDYEITAEDFVKAHTLAIRKSPDRFDRWTRLVFSQMGLGLLIFLVLVVSKQGFSWRLIPAAAGCLLFMAMPLKNRRRLRKIYATNHSMHGMLSLDVDDAGIQFSGPSFSSPKDGWTTFNRFLEDENSFLLYQKEVFNIVIIPKRNLSAEQITALRDHLARGISSRTL